MIVECSKCLRSNILTDPSAPTEANISRPPPARLKAMSYTSLSWAISCVLTWPETQFPVPPTLPTTWRWIWCTTGVGWIVQKVNTCPVSKPQMVQVVSILEVPIKFGSTSFQSKLVSGAQKSEFLFWMEISFKWGFIHTKTIKLHYWEDTQVWCQVLLLSISLGSLH